MTAKYVSAKCSCSYPKPSSKCRPERIIRIHRLTTFPEPAQTFNHMESEHFIIFVVVQSQILLHYSENVSLEWLEKAF